MAAISQNQLEKKLNDLNGQKESCINMVEKELVKNIDDFDRSLVALQFGRLMQIEIESQSILRTLKILK